MVRARRRDAREPWQRLLPGADRLLRYDRSWLRGDVLAGVTVAAYLVPQVMAYAEVAGLPAAAGLWATTGAMLGMVGQPALASGNGSSDGDDLSGAMDPKAAQANALASPLAVKTAPVATTTTTTSR